MASPLHRSKDNNDRYVPFVSGGGQLSSGSSSPGAADITVREVDGNPSVNPVATIEFHQDDGFVVSDQGSSVVRIRLANVPQSIIVDLETDLSNLNSSITGKADNTIDLTAGNGLTGGGDLSANRTFTVGAGNGITVNADDVAVDQAFAFTWTGAHVWSGVTMTNTRSLAANTSDDGLILTNPAAATSGNQSYSPRIRFTGQGWKTNATAASQTVDWIVENQPVQGSANPTSNLVFRSQINGGGYTTVLFLLSGGAPSAPGAGSNSERFGNGALAAGADSVSIGQGASASGTGNIAIGQGAAASANIGAIAIGDGAIAGIASAGATSIAIGPGVATSARGIYIGRDLSFPNNSIILGENISGTTGNHFIVGGPTLDITTVYIGKGITHASPNAITFNATGGSGSNIAGANLNLAAGKGTGTGNPGTLGFQFARPISSGTTLATLSDEWRASYATTDTVRFTANIQTSTTAFTQAFDIDALWATATHASRKARAVFTVYDTDAREAIRIEASGSAPMIGFLGANAVVRQTLSAAATDPTSTQTLANDLRTAMINLGLAA